LKILEAAACGVPVVSTRVGAEGLDFQDGTEILLADDARAFASSVAKLLADPAAAMRQARAARMRAEKLYGWEEIGRRFAAELLSRAQERP
jgi:glycosyltransferase involved in cell wall biosynthesis